MEIWQVLQEPWALRALLASLMVGITCGMLGAFIVLRNMAMIGDALSHAILPGVVVAFLLFGYNTMGFFFGSVLAGLVSSLAIAWIQQNTRTKNDAVIGIVFTAMFSAGVIGISSISRTGVHLDLKDFLFGNVLGVANQDLWMTGGVMIVVTMSVIVFYRYLFASTFQPTIASTMGIPVRWMHYYLMLLLSFAIVAAMQTVGVILVVAMLITPASTALLLAKRLPAVLIIAGIVGFLSSLSGLILSIVFEMPPGPTIAIAATMIYLLAALFSFDHGLIAKWLRRKRQKRNIGHEDLLKAVFKTSRGRQVSSRELQQKLGLSASALHEKMRGLIRKGQAQRIDKEHFQLTEKGKAKANELIRAHRLWESYLVHEIGVQTEHIHDEAEKYEHFLTPAQVDEVDRQLGYPALDPHGSPIPAKEFHPVYALSEMTDGAKGMIGHRQPGAEITYALWDMGIGPGDPFTLYKHNGLIVLDTGTEKITIPEKLAERISVEPA